MRSLKEWYVQFNSIKTNAKTYENYLLSSQRHPGQEIKIISEAKGVIEQELDRVKYNDLIENPDNFEIVRDEKKNREYNRKKRSIKKVGYECVISLPEELEKLSDIDFKKMYIDIFKEYYEWYNINNDKNVNIDEMVSKIYGVKHKNNHIHLILPTISISDLSYIDYSKKSTAYIVKQLVNKYLIENHNISKEKHIIKEDKPQKSLKASKAAKQEKEYQTIKSGLFEVFEALKELYDTNREQLTREQRNKVEKLFNRSYKQIQNNNTNRSEKSLNQIKEIIKPKNQTPTPKF